MLIALDTNTLIDLDQGRGEVVEGIRLVRERIPAVRLIVPPTAVAELEYLSMRAEEKGLREAADTALGENFGREWKIELRYDPVGDPYRIAKIVERLLARGLLPDAEKNDAKILAQSALLNCQMLLTSDKHLREIDHVELTGCLLDLNVRPPLIQSPRDIFRKLFRYR